MSGTFFLLKMTKYFICLHFGSCQLHNFMLKQEKFPKDLMCQISYQGPLKESIKGYRGYLTATSFFFFFLRVHSHVRFAYRSTESRITFTSPGPAWAKSNLIFYACSRALTSIRHVPLVRWESLRSVQELQGRGTNCGLEYVCQKKRIVSFPLSNYLSSHTVVDFRWCLLQKAFHLSVSSTGIEEPVVQRQQHAEGVWQ